MDTLRGQDVAHDQDDFDDGDDAAIESPPAVGSDERRMQVRAYNYWASLLGERGRRPWVPKVEGGLNAGREYIKHISTGRHDHNSAECHIDTVE